MRSKEEIMKEAKEHMEGTGIDEVIDEIAVAAQLCAIRWNLVNLVEVLLDLRDQLKQ